MVVSVSPKQTSEQTWSYPLNFRFKLGDVPFSALVQKTAEGIQVKMQGNIDVLPYSAEAPERRAALLQALGTDGRAGQLFLTKDQRIAMQTDFVLAGQPSLTRFVTEAVANILRQAPASAFAAI